jgi:hypothetical protein
MEKYHPRNQLIHSAPRYLMIIYNPTRAPEAILRRVTHCWKEISWEMLTMGKYNASSVDKRSAISSSLPDFFESWIYVDTEARTIIKSLRNIQARIQTLQHK